MAFGLYFTSNFVVKLAFLNRAQNSTLNLAKNILAQNRFSPSQFNKFNFEQNPKGIIQENSRKNECFNNFFFIVLNFQYSYF
jgi:hypothetical protein